MTRFGGGIETPEEHAHFGTIDVLGGLCGALSSALSLYSRDADGTVTVARTSLAAAGQLIQAPFIVDYEGRPPWDEPSGRNIRGESPTYSLYQASDGWMFVVVPADERRTRALRSILGTSESQGLTEQELWSALAQRFSARTVEDWRLRLAEDGVSIQPLQSLGYLRATHTDGRVGSAPWSSSSFRFTKSIGHPAGHAVTLVAPIAVRPHGATVVIPSDAPKYGEHTDALLLEVGYTPSEIDELVSSGAAGRQWSDDYLPT
jgi:crotonobetainyl-CoA:carnitine CoA-transferase CaiB-like acyl-CoA transferase